MQEGKSMNRKSNIFMRLTLLALVVFFVIITITLQMKLSELENEKSILEKQVEMYSETVEEMEYELTLSREEFIQRYAREVLGYHKNGEIVFKNNSK